MIPEILGRAGLAALRAIAKLPASARSWLARQLRRIPRRRGPPTSDRGA